MASFSHSPRFGRLLFGPVLLLLGLLGLLLAACQPEEPTRWIASAPAGDAYTHLNPDGTTVLPNGRLLTPRGRTLMTAPHPYGLALSRDGRVAVTANSGVRPFSLTILRDLDSAQPSVQQVPEGHETDEGILAAVFMGLAIAPEGDLLYVGGGQEGSVVVFDLTTGERLGEVDANVPFGGRDYEHSYLGDLVLSADGETLYAVDQTNFRLIAVDTESRRLIGSVPTGRYPFGVTLTPDQQRVYVANVGMYEYSLLGGVDLENGRKGVSFPPFAQGSEQAREGVELLEGYQVPGLGDPNAPESFSVWGFDVSEPERPELATRIKTGHLVGQPVEGFPTVGGSSPNSLVSTDDRVYVSNGNNDSVSVISTETNQVVAEIGLRLDARLGELRGHIPFGLALSPGGDRLYVAEAGINAVAVVDTATSEVLGHIPTGWFPSKLVVTPDGERLIVANAKGFGSGPNGGPDFELGPEGSYIGSLMKGFVSVIDLPSGSELAAETEQVVANNFRFREPSASELAQRRTSPVPLFPGASESPIKHLVFITKENRTYDEVFGQLAGGRGEPSLARFGEGVSFANKEGSQRLDEVDVMPNHLALARQFAIGDNFYCDSDVSADGHRWLVGVYPNEWVETSVAASYGGGRRMQLPSTAPGMLAFVGSSGATYPEDYSEAGTIWDHFARHQVEFFNFGLGFEFAGLEEQEFKFTGIRLPINYPMPGPLWSRTSRKFATYNMNIPDQFRVDMFLEEMEARWLGPGEPLPPVLTVFLPNDHGSEERPADGYPFLESYMADNDLALGRVIEFLSSTPYWREMAILVTEDDPQGGVDHLDAHRSVLMVISPWAKRGHVSNVHLSFGSLMKTFWHVLGLPYLNHYDAGATDLADLFTGEPDFSPYRAIPIDPRLFDPQRALDPLDEDFDWQALADSPRLDDVEVMQAWSEEGDERRGRGRQPGGE